MELQRFKGRERPNGRPAPWCKSLDWSGMLAPSALEVLPEAEARRARSFARRTSSSMPSSRTIPLREQHRPTEAIICAGGCMSERVLKIIPADQHYVPSAEQQAKAVAVFREMVPFGEIETRAYDDLEFIDQGQYCEAVLCPSCGNRVIVTAFGGTELAQDWYRNLNETITDRTTPILEFKTTLPCCGASLSLTSLQFDMPAGIARFELFATDPYIESDVKGGVTSLSAEPLNKLEAAMGCKLKQIEARY